MASNPGLLVDLCAPVNDLGRIDEDMGSNVSLVTGAVTGAEGGPWLADGGEQLLFGEGSPDPNPESLLMLYLLGMSSESCCIWSKLRTFRRALGLPSGGLGTTPSAKRRWPPLPSLDSEPELLARSSSLGQYSAAIKKLR